MSRSKLVLSTVAAAVVAFAIAFTIAAQRGARKHQAALGEPRPSAAPSGALPMLWQMPSFSFVDQKGRPTTTADLRGHVWIADFIFTSCTTICPLITAKLSVLQRRLASPALRFVSFSVDPARDTPETLERYAAAWRPGESRWKLLATEPKALEAFAKSMFVIVEPGEKDIGHSKLFFLVDAQGGVRGIYESDQDEALERLVRDVEALDAGAPSAAGRGNEAGAELYAALGCGACHTRPDLAPPLEGLVGRRVKLEGDGALAADAVYVRESIVLPDAKRVQGYPLRMPAYGKELTPVELDGLVAHVVALKAPAAKPTPTAKPSASPSASVATDALVVPEADAAAEEPAITAVDPVCSMTVRVTETTPRVTHDGHTVYFCSDVCKDKFLANSEH